MKTRNWSILGLALVLVLAVSIPVQAQKSGPTVPYGPAMQDYGSSYYGYNGSSHAGAYCPMDAGYGYYRPAGQDYRNYDSRSWGRGHRGARSSWNAGYARGYRGGWGSCW